MNNSRILNNGDYRLIANGFGSRQKKITASLSHALNLNTYAVQHLRSGGALYARIYLSEDNSHVLVTPCRDSEGSYALPLTNDPNKLRLSAKRPGHILLAAGWLKGKLNVETKGDGLIIYRPEIPAPLQS